MPQMTALPEGVLTGSEQNNAYTESKIALEQAWLEGKIIEGRARVCTKEHDLIVDIGPDIVGIIPHDEVCIGLKNGAVREIAVLSRVGKPVCFKIIGFSEHHYILSRRAAQQQALDELMCTTRPGDVLTARTTHLEPFGAFVDIGCGNVSLIGIENISVSRIGHPQERFSLRQDIFAVVSGVDRTLSRINLSHKELLGTWEQNCAQFEHGMTVRGIVRGVEPYGIFIELTPNLSGLAEYRSDLKIGMAVSVYIKAIIPERMKIKLVIIDTLDGGGRCKIGSKDYFLPDQRIGNWRYSPLQCLDKVIESNFT